MKIAISGSGGYIARNLIDHLHKKEIDIVRIPRKLLYSDSYELIETISGVDVVINLAGSTILKRWNKRNKEDILNSRVLTTMNLMKAIKSIPEKQRPNLFISSSAVGIYSNNEIHTEQSAKYSNSFLREVTDKWESASNNLPQDIRRVILRLGIVLGEDSQIIRQMVPVFKLGLGAIMGKGKQSFPFVHISDVINVIQESIYDKSYFGIYNVVAPAQINNQQFTKALANKLDKSVLFRIPEFLLKILYGDAASMILDSPIVIPDRLQKRQFKFNKPTIEESLAGIH